MKWSSNFTGQAGFFGLSPFPEEREKTQCPEGRSLLQSVDYSFYTVLHLLLTHS